MSHYLRKSSNPVLLRAFAALGAAEVGAPAVGLFKVLNDSQWNKPRALFSGAGLYRKGRIEFTTATKGNPDNAATMSVWGKDAAGDIRLIGTSAIIAGAGNINFPNVELGDLNNLSYYVTMSAISGTTAAITTKAKIVLYNPNLDN